MLIAWRRQTSLTTWQFAVITRIKRRGTKIAKDNENEEERKKKRTLFGRVRLSSAVFKETLENFKIANCKKLLVVSFLPTRFQSFLQFFLFFFLSFICFFFPLKERRHLHIYRVSRKEQRIFDQRYISCVTSRLSVLFLKWSWIVVEHF